MTGERGLGRCRAAAGALVLVGAGLLTRSACAPLPASSARAPDGAHAESPAEHAHAGGPSGDRATAAAAPAARSSAEEAGHRAEQTPGSATPPAPGTTLAAGNAGAPALDSVDAPAAAPPLAAASSERQELALLASIERDLKRDPPPAVHALLGDYRGGADRASLVARVQHDFPNDLPLRVTVLRWIDQVRPDPARMSAAPPPPGRGTGTSWVRPLERR